LRLGPRASFSPCNVAPGGDGRRGSPDSGELAHARGRERVGKGSPASEGSISGVAWPREAAGERCTGGRRRWPPRAVLRRGSGVIEGRRGTSNYPRSRWSWLDSRRCSVAVGSGKKLAGASGQRTAAARTGSGRRLCARGEGGSSFIVDARACRGTAIPRPWYDAQEGTPWGTGGPTGARAPGRRGARAGTRCEGGNFKASRGAGRPGEGTSAASGGAR
jgi:hypothetical protein